MIFAICIGLYLYFFPTKILKLAGTGNVILNVVAVYVPAVSSFRLLQSHIETPVRRLKNLKSEAVSFWQLLVGSRVCFNLGPGKIVRYRNGCALNTTLVVKK